MALDAQCLVPSRCYRKLRNFVNTRYERNKVSEKVSLTLWLIDVVNFLRYAYVTRQRVLVYFRCPFHADKSTDLK